MKNNQTLKDIGEFCLLRDYIFPIVKDVSNDLIGDDCAFIKLDGKYDRLVITTDAGPRPLVMDLGYSSYFSWGWYTVLVNVSDLASAGCKPLALSLSIDAPSTMKVFEIEEFYEGISAACKHFEIVLSGGNIRASNTFSSHGTAIGLLDNSNVNITRKDCNIDDILVSIGENGAFISCYLKGKFFESICINLSLEL